MFKVGQKVVCIKNVYGHTNILIEGNEYILTEYDSIWDAFFVSYNGISVGLWIKYREYFRPLDETFAESVLENIKEQIKEEQLILV